jgi:hypothetical protein
VELPHLAPELVELDCIEQGLARCLGQVPALGQPFKDIRRYDEAVARTGIFGVIARTLRRVGSAQYS